ncbi:MAG: DoxX family protein [Gemmatimonadaceae bacterium]
MVWTRGTWALPLRIVIGFGMMYHGVPKLFSATGHSDFVGMLTNLGIPAPGILAWVVGILEFVGGFMLIVGAFVAAVAVLMLIEMAIAAILVHAQHGFNFMNITGISESGSLTFGMPGYEVNLLYMAGLLALAIGGAGAFSVDEKRRGTTTVMATP